MKNLTDVLKYIDARIGKRSGKTNLMNTSSTGITGLIHLEQNHPNTDELKSQAIISDYNARIAELEMLRSAIHAAIASAKATTFTPAEPKTKPVAKTVTKSDS